MKLPRDLSGRAVVKALERHGFTVVRQSGSHVRLVKAEKRVTVPLHRTLAVGTLQSILHQAGLRIDELAL
ncbi:MAG TPA: type II toxin-antitoxin system HicA family toxin [Terriglobia bacterium]|nr:type II toxin-antitoxin system HicA family toxin [Terriglobia bacterium]